ncbi:SDR family oxidoreductase [Sphingosinicella ginsenosidimutans]|uniref:SDR family oxidoreductase n=1 Tax=Allosphingosinicella ginsenosidimutans TaxID=1176539 RepID=A0A5C6TT51_9SPHN|nr:SDR family NAD(P)-dependent oxidoreductase [Sphingosinicella ginsenosidimutans]TXC63436.1 SDR family oxidoreductase [Sphingosinicella ginsenosidimutans]
MYPDLEGKVAIVTGAGRRKGLGEAIARKLAADGVRLLIHDLGRTQGALAPEHGIGAVDELEAVAEDLRAIHPDIATFAADMRVEEEVKALVAHAVERFGRLDILINNAGVGYLFGPLVDATQEMWDTVLNVNLRGAFFATKYAVRQMLTQPVQEGWGRGRIVSIGSRGSKSGSALTSSYIASKHGLVGLTRSAAIELGPEQITVNAVCPNHVTTGLGAWQNEYMAKARGQSVEEYLAAMRSRIPLGRTGTPDDTASACAFLCSGQAQFITGEAMNVSGGEEMH